QIVPGQAEQLPLAQAEHEDQDVRRVERVGIVAGRLAEPPRFLTRPCLALLGARSWQLDQGRDVLRNKVFQHRLRQRGPEGAANVTHSSGRRGVLAALTEGAAFPASRRALGVLALCAALAGMADLVEPVLNVSHLQAIKSAVSGRSRRRTGRLRL